MESKRNEIENGLYLCLFFISGYLRGLNKPEDVVYLNLSMRLWEKYYFAPRPIGLY